MKRLFLDCEFNSFGGELISFGIVPEDSSIDELYIVLVEERPPTEWVARHVIPALNTNERWERLDAARHLARYLAAIDNPVLVADWVEDLSQIISLAVITPGKMVAMPSGVMYQYIHCPNFKTAQHSKIPHNALEDARSLRDHIVGTAIK